MEMTMTYWCENAKSYRRLFDIVDIGEEQTDTDLVEMTEWTSVSRSVTTVSMS